MELLAKKQCGECNAIIPNGYTFCKKCKRDRFFSFFKQWEFFTVLFLVFGCATIYSVVNIISFAPPILTITPTVTKIPTVLFTPTFSIPTNTVTAQPSMTSTPIQVFEFDWTKCRRDYDTRLKIADEVTIGEYSSSFGYNVLDGPYVDRNKIGKILPGDIAKVVDGPSCSNKWIWWKISLKKDGTSGWIPEGDSQKYWLIPANATQAMQVIVYARISNQIDMVNLRMSPGYMSKDDSRDVVVEIPSGQKVKIINGPERADGLNWWYVEWRTYRGWIAEKTGSGKLILIFE